MPASKAKGRRPRLQETGATADEKLLRHIRSLGLTSVDEYRAWCRRHGFSETASKDWHAWRQERLAARKSCDVEAEQAELRRHLEALGLASADQYEEWCRQHSFSESLEKSRSQRQQERMTAERLRGVAALKGAKQHTRRPRETILAIARGEVALEELKRADQRLIHASFAAAEAEPSVHEALLGLLLHCEQYARLLSAEPALRAFGADPGNSLIEALLALARHHADWIRPLEEWRPETHNASRQFGALARHLLVRYFVPPFMDAAWFRGSTAIAWQQQEWFKQIGSGQNIRTADLPLHLTKMMAHHFLQAPADYSIEAAFRWGQILGMGGDENLVRAVNSTRLGESFEKEPFWVTVIQYFVNHPMLDTACVGPLVDYLQQQKFVPREVVREDGRVVLAGPAAPDLSMKGRSPTVLLRQVEAWHHQLARAARKPNNAWEPCGLNPFRLLEGNAKSGNVLCWTIEELLTSEELRQEGKAMNHCVGSYDRSCVKGTTSIWSMQVEDCQQKATRRVMTIAVQNKSKTINQARGKANAFPGSAEGGTRLRKAHTVLHQWARQEGLRLARHL